MNIEQEKMIVEALPSLYPLQEFEEKAIHKVIDALPPAEPKRGNWENIVDGIEYTWGTCDTCGARIPMPYKYYEYCPHCGIKNEVKHG